MELLKIFWFSAFPLSHLLPILLKQKYSVVNIHFCLVAPIPESSPLVERQDTISTMCQQLSQGLSFLSNHSGDPFDGNLSKSQRPEGIHFELCIYIDALVLSQ